MPYTDKHNILSLIENGTIKLRMSSLLTSDPVILASVDWDKVEGMLLGLAVGDSLGNTNESQIPADRRSRYGTINDYLPNLFSDGQPLGLPSDDTQMAFWTLEHMLNEGRIDPAILIEIFTNRKIYGIGMSVSRALKRYRSGSKWYESGVASAGNGALMRVAPIILPYLNNPSADLWLDIVTAATITHNDSTSTACCVAFVDLLWNILAGSWQPDPYQLIDRFCDVLSELEDNSILKSRMPTFQYSGPLSAFVRQQVNQALRENRDIETACNYWGSGAYLLETVPSMLYILCKHLDNFEDAVTCAVNMSYDNDTIASMVGTITGAIHGKSAIPARWLDNLSDRTTDSDDGAIYDLISQARKKWFDNQGGADG